MATTPTPDYFFRTRTDSKGRTYYQFRMPTKREGAWVTPLAMPNDPAVRAALLNNDHLPAWKIAWCQQAYEEFREYENTRKHASKYELDEEHPITLAGLMTTGEWASVSLTAPEDDRPSLADMLSGLDERVAERILLHFIDGLKWHEIAALEYPNASAAELKTAADTIRKHTNRQVKQLQKTFSAHVSDFRSPKDV